MTSLVFVIQDDQVCIAIDTLVVGHLDKRPLAFQRKFVVLQPAGVVIAGTGLADMINSWFGESANSLATLDFDQLQARAQSALKQIAAEVHNLRLAQASLFHFGWSAKDRRYAGFVCRPELDWAPADLPKDQIRMQPEVPVDWNVPFELPRSFVEIQLRQQAADQAQPAQNRQGIGGEIEFVHMHEGRVDVQVVGEFPTLGEERMHVSRRGGV